MSKKAMVVTGQRLLLQSGPCQLCGHHSQPRKTGRKDLMGKESFIIFMSLNFDLAQCTAESDHNRPPESVTFEVHTWSNV